MNRPLVITDCDEVLMHMVVPFAQWVDQEHGVIFRIEDASFAGALKRKECGTPLEAAEVWPLLDGFFTTEMTRQTPIPGALAAMAEIARHADIVVLTNVGPDHQQRRIDQLALHDFHAPVIGSRGGKGEPVRRLIEEYRPSVAVFIDDLGGHHTSVAEVAPDVWRLHLVGEPAIADKIAPSRHAHARIDDWTEAQDWILARLTENIPAPAPVAV
ncbi:MAG: HAD family hydrolase [Sphingopyxis sp.]|uniref:HAD family hydrolase n=1 Tax=Sphingopyxis sp. TaxID=1908224 RepID=UPI003D6D6A54